MQHVLETGKRAISAAVAAATIAFSIGAGALMAPNTTHAASAGDRFRSTSLSTVYYYGYDGMRYVYPNLNTYKSWHMNSAGSADFSGVLTVSDSTISDITLGGNIVMRPGSYWIKVTSNPKTYAVGRDGKIQWIESETVATDFAGSNWNQRIVDVADVFFTDYTEGASLMTATAYDGMMYYSGGSTYLSWGGVKRLVSSAGMTANGLQSMFVMDGAGVVSSALTAGTDLTVKDSAVSDDAQTASDTVVTTGGLTVSASSSMPGGASLPGGANAVEVFRFNAAAGSAAATLTGLTLSMIGAGATTNVSNVYLYEGNTRLTESRTVNSSTRQVAFNNLAQSVSANATRTYTVRVTTSTTQVAADTFGFKIASATDVVSGGAVSGSFPVTGNIFTFTGADAGTLLVEKSGTIADPTIGQQDAVIGQFKITANGTEAASLTSLTLKIDNAADHDDFRLMDGNVLVDVGVNTSGDYVLFDLSATPFAIAEGGNNIFSVSADVGGQANELVKVYADNAVDVVAVGGDFGFGLAVDIGTSGTFDGDTCTSTSAMTGCSLSTIKGGKLTFAFNGPASGDVQLDSQDQVLLKFSITASQFLTIKDMDIQVAADDDNDGDPTDGVEAGAGTVDADGLINDGAEANLKDIKIINVDTGAVVMGPMELDTVTDSEVDETSLAGAAEDALQIIDFTDDWTMNAGESLNLAVTADIDNGMTSGETLAAIFDMSGLTTEDSNGDSLAAADIVPGTDITGYNQTARSASLAFALASTPASVTTVDGTQNVAVIGFTATAGDASDVTVSDFTLSVYGDDNTNASETLGGETNSDVNDYIDSCSLYEGADAATLLAGPEAPASTGETIRFDTINWTIAHGAVRQLTVKCNFANTSASGVPTFAFEIEDASTDVVVEDASGDTFDATGEDLNGTLPTGAGTRFVTLNNNGTLAVSVGSDTPSADFVLASSNNNQVAIYRFTATNEAFNVQTLTFSEEQAEDDVNGISVTTDSNDSTYANNISLVTITYPKADGTTGSATTGMSGNEAKFSSLAMYVPTGSPKDVKVYVNVPGTDRDSGGSATSTEKIRMGLFVDTTNDDNFKIVGAGSGATLDDDDQGAIGDDPFGTDGVATFVVKETKPTITLSSSSPSGSAVVGRSEVLRFNVAASANEDVVLQTLMFKLNATDNAGDADLDWNTCDSDNPAGPLDLSDFDLYNLTDDGTATTLDNSASETYNTTAAHMTASTNNPWTFLTSDGVMCGATDDTSDVAYVRLALPTSEIISKGVTKTFALYMDTTGASSSSDDSVRVDLPTDPILAQASFLSASDLNEDNLANSDTTLTVTASSGYAVGDILCMDTADNNCASGDELMLLTVITNGTTLQVVRGYLNTLPAAVGANDIADDIDRLTGAMLWKDDGVTGAAGTVDDFWGSYLVDNLTVSGGTLVF